MHPFRKYRRALTAIAVFAGFWSVLVVSFAAQLVFTASFPWRQAFIGSLHDWLPWILLSPGVVWLSRKFPLEAGRLRWSLPAHALGCFAALVLCGWISDQILPRPVPPEGRPGLRSESMGPIRDGMPPPRRPGDHMEPGMSGRPGGGPPPGMRRPGRGPAPRQFWAAVLLNRSKLNVPVYWVIVSAVHAFGYYRRVQERDRRALELTASLSQAKLQALRLQMQPHFLFNTLNAISTLVHRDPEAADEMIVNLSELLRLSLDISEQEVPLHRELELLDCYLEIEQVRLGDRLSIHRAIDPASLEAAVPTLVLQTLVENAIRHGVEPRPGPGSITIRSALAGGMVRIVVTDDGVGLETSGTISECRGIGLANTESRLAELYGPAGKLTMRAPETGGVVVEMELPFRVAKAIGAGSARRST